MKLRYEVLDVLGSGGMATVWRARDTDLDRLVAIKRPHPAPRGSAVHERFWREARAAATVSHPNLVTVHDVGVDEDGPYLVMELIEAGSLAEVDWTPALALSVGADIAHALAAVHAAGMVHRDVKPANILVPPGGALLTDFGIARGGDDPMLTREGTTFATPAYAAPEVLAHGAHSSASDVYALAAVLREMIIGHRPAPVAGTQIMITDDFWRPVLEHALDEDPNKRPRAAAFADMLSALPAAAAMPPTTSLTTSPGPAALEPDGRNARSPGGVAVFPPVAPESRSRRPGAWAVAVLALVGLVVAMGVVVAQQGDSGSDSDALTISASDPAVEDAAVETVAPPTPTTGVPTTLTPATVAPPAAEEPPAVTSSPTTQQPPASAAPDIEQSVGEFVDYVSALTDDVIKTKEREKLIEDVDKAIEAANDGDDGKASDKLVDALERIDKQIDDEEIRSGARARVLQIANALGVALDADE